MFKLKIYTFINRSAVVLWWANISGKCPFILDLPKFKQLKHQQNINSIFHIAMSVYPRGVKWQLPHAVFPHVFPAAQAQQLQPLAPLRGRPQQPDEAIDGPGVEDQGGDEEREAPRVVTLHLGGDRGGHRGFKMGEIYGGFCKMYNGRLLYVYSISVCIYIYIIVSCIIIYVCLLYIYY